MADLTFLETLKEIREKLPTIVETSNLFDADIIARLESLADLNIDEIMEDLKKGSYLGNRKIDIDLALNKIGIADTIDYNEIMSIWTNTSNTVYYSKAIITFIDGTLIDIPFVNENGQPQIESSHGGIIDQLDNNIELQDKLINTIIREEVGGKSGSFIRIVDVEGYASNLKRIEFIATSGDTVNSSIVSYWAKSTSAIEIIASVMGNLTSLIPYLLEISLLSTKTNEIGNVSNALEEIIGVFNELTNIIDVSKNETNINTVATDIEAIKTNATDIEAIKTLEENILKITTIFNNIEAIETNATDIEAIKVLKENITAIQINYSNTDSIKNVGKNITSVVNLNNNLDTLNPILQYVSEVVLIAQNIATVLRAGENVEIIETIKNEALQAQEVIENLLLTINQKALETNQKAELVSNLAEDSKNYAEQASQSALNALAHKETTENLITNAQSITTTATNAAEISVNSADRAETVLNNIASVSLIPLWKSSTDENIINYTRGEQVIDVTDVEIYVCTNNIEDSRVIPSLDVAHWKRLIGTVNIIDGGYASTTAYEQTFDGGTANG